MKPGMVSVWREYAFCCARCEGVEAVYEHWAHRAYKEAREYGWRKKRHEGWVCPSCVAAAYLENEARKEGGN